MHLEQLLAGRADLWRGRAVPAANPAGVSTGYTALDAVLPWGGWPPASLSEVLDARPEGALSLVLPTLIRLSHRPRWLLLIDPPLPPFAPTLAALGLDLARLAVVTAGTETAWAAEQGLRSGACSAVLIWGRETPWRGPALRRLQLAAQSGDALALLFRGTEAAQNPSPAALRLRVRPLAADLEVEILKQRGGRPAGVLRLAWPEARIGKEERGWSANERKVRKR
jgi:cell division inhibitor SulA